jgi:hypothetical protein
VDAAIKWARANCNGDPKADAIATTLLKANLRIIVPSEDVLNKICTQLRPVRRCRVTGAAFRTRMLILNGNVAIVHLPIPFRRVPGEQSNFAAIVRGIDGVQELQSWFDGVWENGHTQYVQHRLSRMMIGGPVATCMILITISECEHGVDIVTLKNHLQDRGIESEDGQLKKGIEDLERRGLVYFDRKTLRYYPARRQTVGHMLDSLLRLFNRDVVFNRTPNPPSQ